MTEPESKTDKLFDCIAEKILSIMDKLLDRVDKKLDDDEFMKKIENSITVTITKKNKEEK